MAKRNIQSYVAHVLDLRRQHRVTSSFTCNFYSALSFLVYVQNNIYPTDNIFKFVHLLNFFLSLIDFNNIYSSIFSNTSLFITQSVHFVIRIFLQFGIPHNFPCYEVHPMPKSLLHTVPHCGHTCSTIFS